MNLWQQFEKDNNPNVNSSSISFHYSQEIDEPLKNMIIDFSKWLRKNYLFPIGINVYIVSSYRVQLRDGTLVYGRFRWFPNRSPNIQIAGAIEPNVLEEYEIDTIYDGVLSSLVHELTHYFQWILKLEQDERVSERQANYYRYRIVEKYYATYSKIYRVKGIEVKISDEQIGEAFQYVLPNQRAVLLLSYFKEYTDMEIARLLGISHKTVAYRKKNAMQKLKSLLEGMKHAQKED